MISLHFDLNPWGLILTLMKFHLHTTIPIGLIPVFLPTNISPALGAMTFPAVLLAALHNLTTDRIHTIFQIKMWDSESAEIIYFMFTTEIPGILSFLSPSLSLKTKEQLLPK